MEQSQRISEKVEKNIDRFISRLLKVISDNDMILSLDGKDLTVDDLQKSKDILISDIKNLFHESPMINRLSKESNRPDESSFSEGHILMKSERSADDRNKDRSIENSSEIKLKEIRKLNDREDDEVKESKRPISTIQEIKPLNPVKKIESLNIQEHLVNNREHSVTNHGEDDHSVTDSDRAPRRGSTNHNESVYNHDESVNNPDYFMTSHREDEHSMNSQEDRHVNVLKDKHRKDRIVMVNDYLFNEIRSIIDNLDNSHNIRENLYMLYNEGICSESLLKDMIPDSSEIIENNFKYLNDMDIDDKDTIIQKCKEEYDIYQELLR